MKKIVLIEDDPFFRVMIADLLTLEGFDVTTAVDASQGLQRALTVQPDFILCHAKLPSLDGQAILEQIRGNVSTAHIPFLLLDAKVYLDNRRYTSLLDGCHERSKTVEASSLLQLFAMSTYTNGIQVLPGNGFALI